MKKQGLAVADYWQGYKVTPTPEGGVEFSIPSLGFTSYFRGGKESRTTFFELRPDGVVVARKSFFPREDILEMNLGGVEINSRVRFAADEMTRRLEQMFPNIVHFYIVAGTTRIQICAIGTKTIQQRFRADLDQYMRRLWHNEN